MATKRGLGRGYDSLIPAQTVTNNEEAETRSAGMFFAAKAVNDALRGLNDDAAKQMLRMMIDYCQLNLVNGYRG